MISCIKNNPLKFILAVLLTVILSLNYLGFCFSQMHFLSDEEKLIIVVKDILAADFAAVELEKLDINDERRKRYLPIDRVPYRNIDEFFVLNPNCCQVTINYKSIGGEGDTVSCWNRLTGFKSSVVGVRYLVRYRNNEGIIQSKQIEVFPGINNCGELVWELG